MQRIKRQSNPARIRLHIADGRVNTTWSNKYDVHFLGADFGQIVDDDLVVHRPLTDCTVQLSFCAVHRQNGKKTETDLPLFVAGKYGPAKGGKPAVVPEPAQWYAGSGAPACLNDLQAIACTEDTKPAAEEFAQELEEILGKKLPVVQKEEQTKNAVSFLLDKTLAHLGYEGYTARCENGAIQLCAGEAQGLIWAGKTALQLLAQGAFPCGEMEDYPRYPVRGFMLDAGRRPCSMETLRKIVKYMAWFKMNDFQVHLNDNYIWLEDYAENGDDSTLQAYSAFRLESSLRGENGESPTAADYSYSKADFRAFIAWAKTKGVRIVPEIDVPAHALALAEAFPQHMVRNRTSPLMNKRPLTDHLDISRPETIDFIKRLFDDYTGGDDPVFAPDTVIHIGADEFLSDYGAYRRFVNEIIPYIRKTNPVRMWGGLTWIKDEPATPIRQEAIQNVQMNLWSSDWADGREMYEMGFDLINTIDDHLYMVPDGSRKRGGYKDYLNKKRIFRQFAPNRVRIKTKNGGRYTDLPAGEKRVLGACFAIWNDNIDRRASGLTESDLFARFADAAALLAEKTWGSCTKRRFRAAERAAMAAGAPLLKPAHIDFTLNTAQCECAGNAKPGETLQLDGGCAYAATGLACAPPAAELTIDMLLHEAGKNQILLEADAPYGAYDIRLTENGKLGFTREGYLYEFDYAPPVGKRVQLCICTKPQQTVLQVGQLRKNAAGKFIWNDTVRCTGIQNATFSIPCARIGSAENAVHAEIYALTLRS